MITVKFFGMLGIENDRTTLLLDESMLHFEKVALQRGEAVSKFGKDLCGTGQIEAVSTLGVSTQQIGIFVATQIEPTLKDDEEAPKLGEFTNSALQIEVSLKQVFEAIIKNCPAMTEKQLSQAILFLNKKQLTGRRRLSSKIKDGDNLTFLSPAGGG